MPIYATDRKAKDLYFNGSRIAEAWFESKKVYSRNQIAAWVARDYKVGEQVIYNGALWEAIAPVTGSDKYFQPSTSSYSKRFWKFVRAV